MRRQPEGLEQLRVEVGVDGADTAAGDLDDLQRPRAVAAAGIDPVLAEGGAAVGPGREQARALCSRCRCRASSGGRRAGPPARVGSAASRRSRLRAAGRPASRCRSARTRRYSEPPASARRRRARGPTPRARAPSRPRRRVRRGHLVEGGSRALQRAVDRGARGAQQLGHLAGLPVQDLAQDQHRALARRQVLQARRRRRAGSTRAAPPARPGHRRREALARRAPAAPRRARGAGREGWRCRRWRATPGPSAGPAAAGAGACRDRRWWRSCTARSAASRVPRSRHVRARREGTSPAPHPRPLHPNRASGSSSR